MSIRTMSIRTTLASTFAAALLASTPVLAQAPATPAAATQAPAATSAAPGKTASPAATVTHRNEVVERRIAELHSKLKITAAEQKPFDDFAQAMRDDAAHTEEAMNAQKANYESETAVEQLKAYATVAQAHSEGVNGLVGPFTTLYAALSPEQQKMADQSFRDFASQAQQRERAVRPARG